MGMRRYYALQLILTERLVFFSDDYEIESGQGNDTAAVNRGRQTERPAIESPNDREACLFSDNLEMEMESWQGNVGLHITVPCYFFPAVSLQHNVTSNTTNKSVTYRNILPVGIYVAR